MENASEPENEILTAANEAGFFSRDRPLKAVLFTKKTETPKLWLRLAEEWGSSCIFGEVRMSESSLMDKFGVKEDDLPRVMAFVAEGKENKHQRWPYDGPSDFDRISDFLGDLAKGGTTFLEIRKLAEERQKEIARLKAELEREREAVAIAKAEVARSMLGAVGQGEAMKERERALEAESDKLKMENEALKAEVKAMQEVQRERVLKLKAENVEAFLSSTTRPLKAILFTTKSETPPLWQQLAEAQSTTTAFGVVHHVETALMEKWKLDVADLPRICIFSSGVEPVVYDGEVKLDALSSFLRDTVEGGDAVIAMRQQVHHAMREIERLSTELDFSRSEVERLKASGDQSEPGGGKACEKCAQVQTEMQEAADAAQALAARLRRASTLSS